MRRWRPPALALALLLAGTAAAIGPGDAAPDFAITGLEGHALRLADLRGKLILLNFWASWCGPCIEEMPRLSAWQRTYAAAGLQVVGVSMDDDPSSAERFLAKHPVAYPITQGDARLGKLYGGILGLPQSFLIDRQGLVVAHYKAATDLAQIEADIELHLAGSPVARGVR